MNISIYTITSELHDKVAINQATKEFLGALDFENDFKDSDYSTYGDADLNLIYVRTGGTEGVFKKIQPILMERSSRPLYLLTSGKSNSLAASMEILSYLNMNKLKGEIIHGDAAYISTRVRELAQVESARKKLIGMRLGVIGAPSDWLISSIASPVAVKQKLGIEIVNIAIDEVVDAYNAIADTPSDCATLAEKKRRGHSGRLRGRYSHLAHDDDYQSRDWRFGIPSQPISHRPQNWRNAGGSLHHSSEYGHSLRTRHPF